MSVAGNNKGYTVGLLDANGQPTGQTWNFPRVTEILDSVIAKPKLQGWFYSKTVDGMAELIERFGEKLPSDPTSLKQLLRSHKLSPYSARDVAAESGTGLHAQFETLCKTGVLTGADELAGMENWWMERGLTPQDIIATEQTMVSFKHRYAGTVDVIYKDPETGRIVLSDLKTGKYVHWTHFIQGEAYREAWIENGGAVPDLVSVLHVRPIGPVAVSSRGKKSAVPTVSGEPTLPRGYEEKVAPEVTFQVFLDCLSIYSVLPLDWHPEDV